MKSHKNGLVILLRGIPGCGKSTYARILEKRFGEIIHISSDDFFMKSAPTAGNIWNREYRFELAKLAEAHSWGMRNFLLNLGSKFPIVVDNTFIHRWEMQNYIEAVIRLGCPVEVHEIRVTTIDELKKCIERGTHGVPVEVVAKMAVEFEDCIDQRVKVVKVPFWKGEKHDRSKKR